MNFDLLIRHGMVVSSTGAEVTDIGILNGSIAAIGDLGSSSAMQVLDVRGLTVLPGGIDTQVHFREPGLEHKEDLESGTRAAVAGGITSILEMPNTVPNTTTPEALEDKLRRATGRAWANFGFFVGASTENADRCGELERLPGTPGIKIFMGSSTGSLLVSEDEDLRRVLRSARHRCPIHAEDEPRNSARKGLISADPHPREHPFLRDAESAILATRRILAISEETGTPVHVLHISTGDEPWIIDESRRRGSGVTCEVTPQHLFFCGDDSERLGSLVQMNPPIRSAEHRERIWKALDEDLFDVFGSDHAPHTLNEKAQPYPKSPSGMPGVQTMLPVLLTFAAQGRLSLPKIVRMLCERPAELYGIRRKGCVGVGYDADLVIVDPDAAYEFERSMVQSKCGWSPYEGETLTGRIEATLVGGEIRFRGGEMVGAPGGKMLEFGR